MYASSFYCNIFYDSYTLSATLFYYPAKTAFFFIPACIIHFLRSGVRQFSTFFLLSHLPFPLSRFHALIAIQGARRRSHLFVKYSLCGECTLLLLRIMKLELRPICGPCGAIFFNYSCRSRNKKRRVVANKKALFEGKTPLVGKYDDSEPKLKGEP